MATIQERVAERWPDLLPLLRHPEVGRLLTQAVSGAGMSPGSFMSKLRATRWYRSQPESARQWWVLKAMDPAEARKRRSLYSASLLKDAEALGIKLTGKQVARYTEANLSQGIEAGSDRALANLVAFATARPGQLGAGALKTSARDVRNLEVAQWFREPPHRETTWWAAQIALGRKTLEDFNAAAANSAAHRFPHMADRIRAGETVAQIVGPAVEAYAREMDWDPQGMMSKMHTNPKFAGLTGIKDPKTGKLRLPTEYEARTMARQRDDWWGTTGGRQADAGMTQAMLQAFGLRK